MHRETHVGRRLCLLIVSIAVLVGLTAAAYAQVIPPVGANAPGTQPSSPAALAAGKYTDALPSVLAGMSVATQFNPGQNPPTYTIHAVWGKHQFSSLMPIANCWAYVDRPLMPGQFGDYLGPIIVARSSKPINVQYTNDLGPNLLFPVDPRVMGTSQTPRVLTHLHGGHVAVGNDGSPNTSVALNPGQNMIDNYSNKQEASLLWYHDHALGNTRTNAFAGLAAGYVVTDPTEDALNIPGQVSGPYANATTLLPLVLQDRIFSDGTATSYFPDNTPAKVFPAGEMWYDATWMPEYFGDTNMVNGVVWPKISVQPRKYRLRFINGSQARFYNIRIETIQPSLAHAPADADAINLNIIGNEGGLLRTTAVAKSFLMGNAERPDIIVDFSAFANQSLYMTNDAAAPYPGGSAPGVDMQQIMRFDVGPALPPGTDTTTIPVSPRVWAAPGAVNNTKVHYLREIFDNSITMPGMPAFGVVPTMDGAHFIDPNTSLVVPATANDTGKLGQTDIWEIWNQTPDMHPIHLHQTMFQVVDRQQFYYGVSGGAAIDPVSGAVLPANNLVPVIDPLTGKPQLIAGTKFGPMVIPGDPDSSNLMRLLDWRTSAALRMPHNKKQLSSCDRSAIREWIREGAKNN